MNSRSRRIGSTLVVLAFGGWIVEHGPIIRDKSREADKCVPKARASIFALPPSTALGFSVGFEQRVPWAFPVGACAADLIAWLNWQGFSPASESVSDSYFIDTPEKAARNAARRAEGKTILLAGMSQKAIIGRSVFSVAWNSDQQGLLTEVFADAELLQLDMP
jgi:hypothetical protein